MNDNPQSTYPDEPPGVEALEPGTTGRVNGSRSLLIAGLAIVVIAALVAALFLVPRFRGEDNGGQDAVTGEGKSQDTSTVVDGDADRDSDGLSDSVELAGLKATDGAVYFTNPNSSDTDNDGLSDTEEAGKLTKNSEGGDVFEINSDPTDKDSDDDGLGDEEETAGWVTNLDDTYRTNPREADTDGDGLTDAEEAGRRIIGDGKDSIFTVFSNPTIGDTDEDGLSDLEEADEGSDPNLQDSDVDGLSDLEELLQIGSDPNNRDTDGDGFDDAYEVANRAELGFDPLFEDVETSPWSYASDFAKGAFAGDAMDEDSVAWLAGNLAVTGAGFIPVAGVVISGIADLRDLIIAGVKGDWLGMGFAAVSLVPFAGDASAVPKKAGKFLTKHPERAVEVGGLVTRLDGVPESLKLEASRVIWKNWDYLIRAKAQEKGLLQLQKSGRMYLDRLADYHARPLHRAGESSRFLNDGRAGELALEKSLRQQRTEISTQVKTSTSDCVEVCNPTSRRFDVVANGVAHESKVGYVYLTDGIRRQINSDAYAVETGQIDGAHWHFYPSSRTDQLGASSAVMALLEEKGIPYTIHLPRS